MTKTVTNPNDTIIRLLSTGAIISSLTFGKLAANKQTEILAIAMSTGKPPVFVDSFGKLTNTKLLADKLLRGDDVSMELEFNSISVSDEEKKALKIVKPLLKRLKALKPSGYQWLSDEQIKAGEKEFYSLAQYDSKVYDRAGNNSISRDQAERIWKAYAKFMVTGEKPASMIRMSIRYTNRQVSFNQDGSVKIGCTTVSRAGVEAVARKFGFKDPTAE